MPHGFLLQGIVQMNKSFQSMEARKAFPKDHIKNPPEKKGTAGNRQVQETAPLTSKSQTRGM